MSELVVVIDTVVAGWRPALSRLLGGKVCGQTWVGGCVGCKGC